MAHKDIFRYFREDYAGHSKASAYLLALLSHYIYTGKPPGSGPFETAFKSLLQDLSDTNPFEVQTFTENTAFPYDTEAAVLSNQRLVLVVFRGTEGLTGWKDWITNSKHLMLDCPPDWGAVKAHKGFYNALSAIYQGVRSEVRSRRTNNQKVDATRAGRRPMGRARPHAGGGGRGDLPAHWQAGARQPGAQTLAATVGAAPGGAGPPSWKGRGPFGRFRRTARR